MTRYRKFYTDMNIQIIKKNHIDKIIVKLQNHQNKVAHRVAHRVAHGLAHGLGPRFCPHPFITVLIGPFQCQDGNQRQFSHSTLTDTHPEVLTSSDLISPMGRRPQRRPDRKKAINLNPFLCIYL